MQKENILFLSLRDFFSKKMLKFSFLPLVITLIIMYMLFFFFAGMSLGDFSTLSISSSTTTMQDGIEHTETFNTILQDSAIIQFLMSYSFTSWIGSFFVYSIGAFLTLYLSIFIAIIVVGFLTPNILKELHKRHYNDLNLNGHSNIVESMLLLIKWAATMMMLFFLLIPLYFIPLLNIVALHLPLYYFFHKMLNYDITSNICLREEAKEIRFKNKWELRLKTLGMYLLSLIPFSVFFTTVFYVIYLGNTYFFHLKRLQNK